MQLEKIITLANAKVKLRFLAMVRSLRATGCNLPVWVIPYDDNLFDLPEKCSWVNHKELMTWLGKHRSMGMYRKYFCLMQANYQFVDSDVIFLRNPQEVLKPHDGFITSCGHWHNPEQTYTEGTLKIFREKSTTWQADVFNAGQFACSQSLYDFEKLVQTAEQSEHLYPCLQMPHHDQAGLNLLVHLSAVNITNLTLPPHRMQSTWAGDYTMPGYTRYWKTKEEIPYLIHWAGSGSQQQREIDRLFLDQLTEDEQSEWSAGFQKVIHRSQWKKLRRNMSRLKIALKNVKWE